MERYSVATKSSGDDVHGGRMIPLGSYTSRMKRTEDEALREYTRRLDNLMSFVGREEMPYSLRTLHMDRLLTMAREAREARKEGGS
jgi:hypothetical protein